MTLVSLAFHVTENAWVHASHADKRPIRLLTPRATVAVKPKRTRKPRPIR